MNESTRPALVSMLWTLAFVVPAHAANEPTAIYTMNVDGSEVRMLARAEGFSDHASPRWSHDGTYVVFDALPIGGGTRVIFMVGADGQGLREFGPGAMPSWSPDDKQIVSHSQSGNLQPRLFVQNANRDGRAEFGLGLGPQWSPDGGTLATTDGKNLYLIDAISDDSTALFVDPFFEVFKGFKWSPNGQSLAMTVRTEEGAQRQLMIVNVAATAQGATVRLTSNLGGFVSFSPDGKQLVFATDNTIHLVQVGGNSPPVLVPGQTGKNIHPDWSPDGKKIVFVSDRDLQ